jgi:hypothetical protein
MIKKILGLSFVALCMYACSPDITELEIVQDSKPAQMRLRTGIDPENSANPYDGAGKVYYKLLSDLEYHEIPSNIHSVVSAVESHALLNDEFRILAEQNYVPISQAQKEIITGINSNTVSGTPLLSDTAKERLKLLFSKFSAPGYAEEEFNLVYDFLIGYEQGILQDTNLNSYEKKTILITATIARHTAARDKGKGKGKGKDKDWRLSVNSIVSAAAGAMESEAKAVTMSMSGGIYNADGI